MGAIPPHIKPCHWVFAPAWEPLLKAAGRGCAVTLSVAFCVVPFAEALMVALKASKL